ncbi:SusD/RagB family nutrient-binding outer membrane lipoprotein [Pedobacter psychrodurus]|uniref:SusD/RagB family nutrient-binding outer membrane lipoprotein n=1 Tax=Pedobacter psychrodurus TaxID=2530456 RepID=A0A4R0Q3F8_9SPHI|nr:SusD/RagB family nutrient-binding outer membrane lipoprotein [Pedobacter psychrodurus]TCD26987.1 SusD/RagB family nutrient-binding outer membrane lipoprotein [Pedobacter psychrodurus]
MKNKKLYILAILAIAFSSCNKELDEVNINPNAPEIPQPDYLLTGTTKATVDSYWGVTNNMNSSLLFAQHWAKVQYTEEDRFIYSNSSFTALWSTGYAQSIAGFNKIIELSDAQGNSNYKGVALVLRSWTFLLLTDAYGDIPYSQAGKIKQFVTPAYDKQKDVYYGILNDLKSAQAALDPAGPVIVGDVIYNNKIASWKKFANALRLRIALRIADRDPAKAKQVIDEVQAEGGAYISSNSENAILKYDVSPQQNPVAASFETRNDYRISKTIVDKLISLNDPRLPIYASKTENAPQGYVGIPNGSTNSEASAIGLANSSKPGAYFLDAKAPAVIFSYAELLFDRAEAAARGFTTEDAEDLYKQAIRASFLQYNIGGTAVEDYIKQSGVVYNAANYKKSIGEQKWIALFGQGLEAWTERRRLDYPQLTASVNTVLNGQIPVRFIYPGTEQSLNGQNYKNAVSNQGADLLTTKLWFDAF